MILSKLQEHILLQTYVHGPRVARSVFESFYTKPSDQDVKVITVSIERLISKGLIKGYGYKTAEKLFIQQVSLTSRGKMQVKKHLSDRQRLPFAQRKNR